MRRCVYTCRLFLHFIPLESIKAIAKKEVFAMNAVEEVRKAIDDRNIRAARRKIQSLDRLSEQDEVGLAEALADWEKTLKQKPFREVGMLLKQIGYAIDDLTRVPR